MIKTNKLFFVFIFCIYFFLLAPQIIIVILSFSGSEVLQFPITSLSLRWYAELFINKSLISSLFLSLRVAVSSTIFALIVGIMAVHGFYKYKIRMKVVLEPIFMTPLIIPYIILAIGLSTVFNKIGIRGSVTGLILAHTVIAIPYVVMLVGQGYFLMKKSINEAANTLGANDFKAFFLIILPSLMPNILVAGFFSFITSFDDAVISYFITGPSTQTLPIRIWSMLKERVEPVISTIATIWMVLILVVAVFYTKFYSKNVSINN